MDKILKEDDVHLFKQLKDEIPIFYISNFLSDACSNGAFKIAEYIIDNYNTDLDIINIDGNTLLIIALSYQNYSFAHMLLDYGFTKISHRNNTGLNCFSYLVYYKNSDKFLLEKILAVNTKTEINTDFHIYSEDELKFTEISSGSYSDILYDHKNKLMLKTSKKNVSELISEAFILRLINKINPTLAVTFKGIFIKNNQLYLVLEELNYCLYDVFDLYHSIDIGSKRSYLKAIYNTIISIVDKLNNIGIIHRDIKPNNIMIDQNGNVRFLDFGLSEFIGIGRKQKRFIGTKNYKAPDSSSLNELKDKHRKVKVTSNKRNYSSDIFSIATIIVYSIILREVALYFSDNKVYEYSREDNSYTAELKELSEEEISKFNDFSPLLLDLLKHMFCLDSNYRYTAKDCLQHEFFTNVPYTKQSILLNPVVTIDMSFYSCDDITLKRGELCYSDEIYEFYKQCIIPKSEVDKEVSTELLFSEDFIINMTTLMEFDKIFNRNILFTTIKEFKDLSIEEQIDTIQSLEGNIFDYLYSTKNDKEGDDMLPIFETMKLSLTNDYIPISVISVIQSYIVKLQQTELFSSTINEVRNMLYMKFYEKSLSHRTQNIKIDDYLRECIMEISMELKTKIQYF